MKSSAAAKSYAKALFSLAKERNQIDAIGTDLANARQLFADAPELRSLVGRPWVAPAAKRAVVAEVATQSGLSQLARDFLALVVAQGRGEELEAIVDEYRERVDADAGRVRARVRTAVTLTEDEQRTLAARLGRELGGKQVIVEQVVDPTLLGGFIAEVGSLVLDGSLDGQLARLRDRLVRG